MQTNLAIVPPISGAPNFVGRLQVISTARDVSADALEAIGTVQSVRAGCGLYAEGDAAGYWYRVTSGVLRTCKLLPDGRRQIDDFLFPGDFFGLEARPDHSFAAEAVTGAAVVRYSRTRLDLLAADDVCVSARLLQLTLKQLGKAHERLLLLGRKTAGEKLASFLLEMLDRSPALDSIDLPMSRTDIADYLGLTIETVSRTFSSLKQNEVVALPNAQRVIILDRDALEELTGDE
ncbi:MAG: fixK [Rhodospirillales bacterium]|nr:fixK [Rhodospirillales bacterium]